MSELKERTKFGYGNFEDIDKAIEQGMIDGNDLIITKDTCEIVYITSEKNKQVIRPRILTFDSEETALYVLNNSKYTYHGQLVNLLIDDKCILFMVQYSNEKESFVLEQVANQLMWKSL